MAEADHPILEDSMEKSWHLEVEAAGEEAGRSFYLIQNITSGEYFPSDRWTQSAALRMGNARFQNVSALMTVMSF